MNLGLSKLSRKVRERAEMCRAEAELASEPRRTELLEIALAYERMIERAKRHFELSGRLFPTMLE